MKLDIKKAYLSPFSEKKWYIRLIFPTIMAAMSFICNPNIQIMPRQYCNLFILITLIPGIILSGFFIQFQHNEIRNEQPLLPVLKSNISEYARHGIRSIIFILFYSVIDIFIILLALILLKMELIKIISILISIIAVTAIIFVFIAANIAIAAYADNFNVEDAFNINRICLLIFSAKGEICVFLFMALILSLLSGIICAILGITIIGMFFIPIVIAILQLIIINLEAQVYKAAKFNLESTNTLCQE